MHSKADHSGNRWNLWEEGLEVALGCDLRIATPESRFAHLRENSASFREVGLPRLRIVGRAWGNGDAAHGRDN